MSFTPACLVIAGPSGVGKTSVIQGVLAQTDNWRFSVSATTRPIREGEEDGREYHFLDRLEFERRILAGEFLEYADVYGNLYGTPAAEFDRAAAAHQHLLIEVDTVGCLSIRALRPEIPMVAILPPSMAALKQRLQDRGTESDDSLRRRLSNVVAEFQRMRGFDYAIINDELAQAQRELHDLMKIVERGLVRVTPLVDDLLLNAGGRHEIG
ncbi:guanylate kinase [bacterium]|nr:guanylate kinase [bacterium]